MSYEKCMTIINNFSVEKQRQTILNFIQDETKCYSLRLKVWQETPVALQVNKSWLFHHPNMQDDEWYKYDWWNRGQRIDLTDMAQYHEWDKETERKFYEGCMKQGVWSFTYDW